MHVERSGLRAGGFDPRLPLGLLSSRICAADEPSMTNATEKRIPIDDLLVFHQLARSLTSSFDLDTILRTILEHMERFIQADLWSLVMLDETRQDLYYAIAAGGEEASLRDLRVKLGEGVAGWVVEHG